MPVGPFVQFQPFQHGELGVVPGGCPFLISCFGGILTCQFLRFKGLKLDGIGTGFNCCVHQLFSSGEAAVVVHTGFGDDKYLVHGYHPTL